MNASIGTRSTLKALVISNFPKQMFDQQLRPKLNELGIDVCRLLTPDRSDINDVGEATLVISFNELMSRGQNENVKKIAKRNNRPFIQLTRKAAYWAQALSPFMELKRDASGEKKAELRLVMKAAAPPEEVVGDVAEEPLVEDTDWVIKQQSELIAMYEEENTVLLQNVKQLTHDAELKDAKVAETSSTVTKAGAEAAKLAQENAELRRAIGNGKLALEKAEGLLNQAKEDHREEVSRLSRRIRELEARPSSVVPKSTIDIFKALESLRHLVKIGMMTPDEAFEKLSAYKPEK